MFGWVGFEKRGMFLFSWLVVLSMVDKYAASVRVEMDEANGMEEAQGSVEVVMDVPVSVTGYDGEVTDEDIESAAIEAIQEGEARVVEVRPTVRQQSEAERRE